MSAQRADLLQGTLDLLILRALRDEALHGWGISKKIQLISRDVLAVQQGSLYPALYRLEDRGWIRGIEGRSPEGRRIRIYRLTRAGQKQLEREIETWRAFSGAMELILRTL